MSKVFFKDCKSLVLLATERSLPPVSEHPIQPSHPKPHTKLSVTLHQPDFPLPTIYHATHTPYPNPRLYTIAYCINVITVSMDTDQTHGTPIATYSVP